VEASSEHPIAHAIIAAATQRDISPPPASDFAATAGEGARAVIDGRRIAVLRDAQSTCQVTVDDVRIGRITVADTPRPDAAEAVDRLHKQGLTVTMLSGDRAAAAQDVGREVGIPIDEIHADQTPATKAAFLDASGEGSIMVGDGINDAAALATATVGVAMGSGTNIAIETADVVIPSDRVTAIPETIDLARRCSVAIKQNLVLAFVYNTAAVPVAALGLLGMYGPLVGAGAMALSDLMVIGNAVRLKVQLKKARTDHA
jgi:Cu+-exporting ATPase